MASSDETRNFGKNIMSARQKHPPTTETDEEESELELENDDDFPETAATPGLTEDEVKKAFERDLQDARDFSQQAYISGAEKKKAQMEFVKNRQEGWKRQTEKEKRNFLHVLAYYDYTRKPALQWLMARAILKLPELMGVLDSTKRTPLTVAISVGNEMFVHAACKNVKDDTRKLIGEYLEAECIEHDNDREITCLHTAIWNNFNPELTSIIISFVPEKMFSVVDFKGRTPLHLAVDFETCCATQVDIVTELLRRGPAALDVLTHPDMWKRSHSVFQYHENTRRGAENRISQAQTLMKRQEEAKASEGETEPKAKGVAEVRKFNPAMPTGPLHGHGEPRSKSLAVSRGRGDTGSHGVGLNKVESGSASPSPIPGDPGRAPRPLVRVATGHLERLPSNDPGGKALNSPSAAKGPESAEDRDKERVESADAVKDMLKLIYLRRKKPHEAAQYLHIQDEKEMELWFDFGPPRTGSITQAEFRKHFGHLQFDRILQYVAFPRVELNRQGDASTLSERCQGRQDMEFFFDWLWGKGVRRIIKVIVDDLGHPPHSDEAIEKALQPFGVEILDWRRLDLDPTTLEAIGKNLREVHLQWSGRNTVLRAWSEPEGLAKTPTLETIRIIQAKGLSSYKWTMKNLADFKVRLHKSWPEGRPKPEVHLPETTNTSRSRTTGQPGVPQQPLQQEPSIDPHRWMQCMEEFSSAFRQIKGLNDRQNDPALNPITVALIDDGADITHPELNGKRFPGKSFHDYTDGSSWRVSPYWHSASGHGTLMARLIHRICPSAIIYVIKLQTYKPAESNKLQINPESAIRAIEHAIEQSVQIISMSWTMKPPDNTRLRNAFDTAIHRAKGIILFCSASDQGKFQDFTYPHSSNPNGSFRIGAAKTTGSMADFVGDAHLNFILPGHNVVFKDSAYADVADKGFQSFASHTGSSVATALAAGLAALVMECVRLGVFYTKEMNLWEPSLAIRKEDLLAVRDRSVMEYALSSIGVNRQTDNKYIEVWDTFSGVAPSLRENEGVRLNQLEIIAGLARMFLRKGVNTMGPGAIRQ